MLKYVEKNVNPKNRKTGDCAVRAIVGTVSISYEQALKECYEVALKTCYGITDKQVVEGVLKKHGYIKMKQPRRSDNTKYTVRDMDKILTKQQMKEGVLITVAGHHTCIVNGAVQDIWDCRDKSVGNYYIKAE